MSSRNLAVLALALVATVTLAGDLLAEGPAAQPAADWAQWRGPQRDGTAGASPALSTNLPVKGPVKIWESEKIPTYNDGGLGSVAVAGGAAVIYSNWKYRDPILTRTLNDDGLRQLGWLPEKPPEDLLTAMETTRLSDERAALPPDQVNAWVDKWLAEHIQNEDLKKKFWGYAQDRLRKGRAAMDWTVIDKLVAIRNKTFATQPEMETWLKDNGFEDKAKADVLRVVPTTVEKANDVVLCFDAATGAVKWRAQLPAEPRGWDNSATPCLADGRCYILATGGQLLCLDMKDGSVLWKGKAAAGSGSSSAAVLDGRVYVVAGGLMAFDAADGSVLWKQPAVGHSHASPVFWRKDDRVYILCNSGNELACVAPADGAVLWKTAPGGNNSTPVVSGDFAVVQGEGSGLTAYRLAPDKAEKLWNMAHNDRGSSPVIRDGYVYVLSGGGGMKAMCVKLESGQVAWEEKLPNTEIGSPILADGKLLSLINGGKELYMLAATPEKYALLAKTTVDAANCTSPAIVCGKLYLRTNQGVACYDLTQSAAPAPTAQ